LAGATKPNSHLPVSIKTVAPTLLTSYSNPQISFP